MALEAEAEAEAAVAPLLWFGPETPRTVFHLIG